MVAIDWRSKPDVASRKYSETEASPLSYNLEYAKQAASLVNLSRSSVLVVGCNTGLDCKILADLGAAEVHGLDVVDGIGSDFSGATYHKASIEDSGLPPEQFDLVYAVATMEHVPDVFSGFAEMARLVKPGGAVYSLAAPLWYSAYGHHMGCFSGHPWVHVSMSPDEIVQYAKQNGIDGERGIDIESIVEYMTHPEFFNMVPASDYVDACAKLLDIKIMKNKLHVENESSLATPLGQKAIDTGRSKLDLLSVSHLLTARKRGGEPNWRRFF